MPFEHKELKGSLFATDHPNAHLSGTVKVKGEEYWITVWDRDEGKIHWNVTLKLKQPGNVDAPPKPTDKVTAAADEADRRAEQDDLDDTIPF